MKVRLHDDTIRIRLSQSEVERLADGHTLHSVTHFGIGQLDVLVVPEGPGLDISFENSRITVGIAAAKAAEWGRNDQEGLYAMSGPCKIAVEKDYACLHRTGDANVGTFPNPAAS